MTACSAYRCNNRSENKKKNKITLHRFPKDPKWRKLWIKAVRRKGWTPSRLSVLCSKHFEEKFFIRKENRVMLEKDAIPSIFQKIPMDAELSDDENRNYELQLEDEASKSSIEFSVDSLTTIEKSRPVVHSLFHNLHANLTENIPEAKFFVLKYIYSKINPVATTIENSHDKENAYLNLVPDQNQDQNLSTVKESLTYENLLKNWLLIKKPNHFWSITATPDFIICARWSEDYIAKKRVVIESSLVVRVFLKEWEINISDLMDITCIDDISNLLEKVESYKIS